MSTSKPGGIDLLTGGNTKPKLGRPKTSTRIVTKSSQEGTKENETRATFIVNENHLELLKAWAYWERLTIKELVHSVFAKAIKDYQTVNGPIKTPKKQF